MGDGSPNLTQAVWDTLVCQLSQGHTISYASKQAGVSSALVRIWCGKGRKDPDGPYGPFAQAIEAAVEEGDELHASNVAKAAFEGLPETTKERVRVSREGREDEITERERTVCTPDWKASAWLLTNPMRRSRVLSTVESEETELSVTGKLVITHEGQAKPVRVPTEDEDEEELE